MISDRAKLSVVVVLMAVLAIAIGVFVAAGSSTPGPTESFAQAGRSAAHGFGGIPQRGNTIGYRQAPYRLVEYGDLQCPYCREFDLDVLPYLVRQYVRTKRVLLEFRVIASVGDESVPAALAAYAAAEQQQFWPFVDAFYRQQRKENTGYVTGSFLAAVAGKIPGLAFGPWVNTMKRSGQSFAARVKRFENAAIRLGIPGTPAFYLSRAGRPSSYLDLEALTPDALRSALDARGVKT